MPAVTSCCEQAPRCGKSSIPTAKSWPTATEKKPPPKPAPPSSNARRCSRRSSKDISLRPTHGKPPNSSGFHPADRSSSSPPRSRPSVATPFHGASKPCRDAGLTSTWRLLPDIEIGVVSLPGPAAQLDRLADALSACATGRVGVSPPYNDLRRTPQALTLARIALTSTLTDGGVTVFDRDLLAAAAVSAPDVMNHLARTALAGLADLPDKERAILLETFEAWLDNNGSTQAAAEQLYVHRNTVHHRLRKLELHTGQDLANPRSAALLTLAFEIDDANDTMQGKAKALRTSNSPPADLRRDWGDGVRLGHPRHRCQKLTAKLTPIGYAQVPLGGQEASRRMRAPTMWTINHASSYVASATW